MAELHFPTTPREVNIAITGKCNLSCEHCSYASEMASRPDLPTASWLAFFEELEACKVMKVALTGGEPFMRPDLPELLEGIIRHKMRFSLTTNATLISEEIANYLKSGRRLEVVQVSIEGSRAEIHERLRGQGSFEPALRGLKLLIAAGLPVAVRVTVTPYNLDDLNNLLPLLVNLGVKAINVNECHPMGNGLNNYDTLALTPEQYVKAIKILLDFNESHPGLLCGQAGPFVAYARLKAAEESLAEGKPMRDRGGYLSGCNCVFQAISVLHDGRYVLCQQLPNTNLGNIRTDRLSDVWDKSPLINQFRARQEISLKDFEECRDCRYQTVCVGGCPARQYHAAGDLARPETSDCFRALREKGMAVV